MAQERLETQAVAMRLESELGPDLCALIASLGSPLLAAAPITTIPSAEAHRASFRLTFADGTVLKGRRVNSLPDADRFEALSALLDPHHYPRPVARHGRAFLEPWIAGEPLPQDHRGAPLFRACGSLHAALHRLPHPAASPHLRRRPLDWEQHLDGLLAELVTRDALGAGVAREVARLARLHAPPTTSPGICHTDFCGENIVMATDGTIVVVDNENITIDAHEYDLARTWYRWPMTDLQQHAYAEGYGRHAHGDRFARHFFHWALIVLVESTTFRVRARADSASVPLKRLAGLLRSGGRGELLPHLLSRT
jgi:hypothetical protein